MGLEFKYQSGQTPINEEEKEGLRIKTITTQGELDALEQANIEKAIIWLRKTKPKREKVLTQEFLMQLHKKMFEDVWSWAGKFRRSDKNIGDNWTKIPAALCALLEHLVFWVENNTFIPEKIALEFKHRLVNIHCFANGNGRHSRIMADVILQHVYGVESFGWGRSILVKPYTFTSNSNQYQVE